jgi:hypothetical protein
MPDSSLKAGSASAPRIARHRIRRGLFVAIGLLYIASVPWYRDDGDPLSLIMGLPDWVAVALACYIGVAVLNTAAWLLTEIEDPERLDPSIGTSSERGVNSASEANPSNAGAESGP